MKYGDMIGLLCLVLVAGCGTGEQDPEEWSSLNGEWRFRKIGEHAWGVGVVPGTVHTDLMAAGAIPDPYHNSNIDSVQWVENVDFEYERDFVVDASTVARDKLELVFKGLDTFAEIRLNDSLVGTTDNMHRTWIFPVNGMVREGRNRIHVVLRSALKRGEELLLAYGRSLPADNDAGSIKVSPFVRKAGVHFGWDFAPRLVTCGIWQDVGLRAWDGGRIGSVRVFQRVEGDTRQMQLEVDFRSIGRPSGRIVAHVNGREVGTSEVDGDGGWRTLELRFSLPDTGLWWPKGHGAQPLHELRVSWVHKGSTVADWSGRIGLRSVHLDQRLDSIGQAFTFVVNGQPVFAKGANVVPPDQFLPRAGDSAWVALVQQAASANMNMLRVWGGGVYPPDAFFDACDREGIMVWQDLMFANTMVPDDDPFLDNVRDEVSDQVRRLQHHASLALWCGNNEVDVAWHNWGWQRSWNISATDSTRMWSAYSTLFNELIPSWVYGLDKEHGYVPTSPASNWGNEHGLRNGDLHYWGVWHADSTFASFKGNTGRFMSEYGWQSYPDSATLAQFIDPEHLTFPSAMLRQRQMSYRTDRPIQKAIERELDRAPRSLSAFCEASQQVQALAYAAAIEAHSAARPRCMGTLLWQLNDVWPGPSWSIISYGGRPKAAYKSVRAAYAREGVKNH